MTAITTTIDFVIEMRIGDKIMKEKKSVKSLDKHTAIIIKYLGICDNLRKTDLPRRFYAAYAAA